MGRAVAGMLLIAVVATTPLWIARQPAAARAEPVTWERDLQTAVDRASEQGKALAILFR